MRACLAAKKRFLLLELELSQWGFRRAAVAVIGLTASPIACDVASVITGHVQATAVGGHCDSCPQVKGVALVRRCWLFYPVGSGRRAQVRQRSRRSLRRRQILQSLRGKCESSMSEK